MFFQGKEYTAPLTVAELAYLHLFQCARIFEFTDENGLYYCMDSWTGYAIREWHTPGITFEKVLADIEADGWKYTLRSYPNNEMRAECHYPPLVDVVWDTFTAMAAQKGINCNFSEDIKSQFSIIDFIIEILKGYGVDNFSEYAPPFVLSEGQSPKLPDSELGFIYFDNTYQGNVNENDTLPCFEAEITPEGHYRLICPSANLRERVECLIGNPAYRVQGEIVGTGANGETMVNPTATEPVKGKLIPAGCKVVGKQPDNDLILEYVFN